MLPELTNPDDIGILLEPLATGRHIHHLPPDPGLGVLPDGGLPLPPGSQRGPEIVLLRGIVSLPFGGAL